jgi:hypothetical protein
MNIGQDSPITKRLKQGRENGIRDVEVERTATDAAFGALHDRIVPQRAIRYEPTRQRRFGSLR